MSRKDLARLHGLTDDLFDRLVARDRALRVASANTQLSPTARLRKRAMRQAFETWSAGRVGRWIPPRLRPWLFERLGRRFVRRAVFDALRSPDA